MRGSGCAGGEGANGRGGNKWGGDGWTGGEGEGKECLFICVYGGIDGNVARVVWVIGGGMYRVG